VELEAMPVVETTAMELLVAAAKYAFTGYNINTKKKKRTT
jgi:hypothetical protein